MLRKRLYLLQYQHPFDDFLCNDGLFAFQRMTQARDTGKLDFGNLPTHKRFGDLDFKRADLPGSVAPTQAFVTHAKGKDMRDYTYYLTSEHGLGQSVSIQARRETERVHAVGDFEPHDYGDVYGSGTTLNRGFVQRLLDAQKLVVVGGDTVSRFGVFTEFGRKRLYEIVTSHDESETYRSYNDEGRFLSETDKKPLWLMQVRHPR